MNEGNILHYIHYNKLWYFWFDGSEDKKCYRPFEVIKSMTLLSPEELTEREAKELLQELFPNNVIMKALPFHSSSSKKGSRPKKNTVDRKRMRKEKENFIKEISVNKDI